MPETRSQAKERTKIRNKVIDNIKSKTTSATATMASTSSSTEFVPTGIFPLLRLPIELQNIVYKYAVAEPDEVIMLDNAGTPALARVNRYLRRNVVPIFLEVNTFRIFTEDAPVTEDNQPRDAKFKIQATVWEWLELVGLETPLFKSVIIHFGAENETELVMQYSREAKGFTLAHDVDCGYCNDKSAVTPILPRAILDGLGDDKGLRGLIDEAQKRDNAVKIEHDITIADLATDIFGDDSGFKQESLALSMANIMGLERIINQGKTTFAVAVHTINQKRMIDTPLVVTHESKPYVLLRDTTA
ncbi:hypothetical protein D6C89_07475 [Aureobasidium pullulans]|nr:hypothetical protein D6C89_07475 [Aureobasidium pullulans]